MRIVQIINEITYGNGVSSCALVLADLMTQWGYQNEIGTLSKDPRVNYEVIVFRKIDELKLKETDVVIYHFYDGHELNYEVENLPNRKIIVYQNVTPAKFFRDVDCISVKNRLLGEYDMRQAVRKYNCSIVMSEYNKKNMVEAGWDRERVHVIPLIGGKKKHEISEKKVLEQLFDGKINFLFTGRITLNKKIEDIIRVFDYYQKNKNSNSRLILVGGYSYPCYTEALLHYIAVHAIENVIFTGHVSDEELEAYYQVADVFVCMSEHEGFCIPLMEAMEHRVPVIAYNAAAVPDTLGGAGILVNTKNPKQISDIIEQVLSDADFREEVLIKQDKRVKEHNIYAYEKELKAIIDEVCALKEWEHVVEDEIVAYMKKTQNSVIKPIIPEEGYNEIVIYGNGTLGKRVVNMLYSEAEGRIKAICDNGSAESEYRGIPVLRHDACVESYPNAVYVVTPWEHKVDIIANLLDSGIARDKIKLFDFGKQKFI